MKVLSDKAVQLTLNHITKNDVLNEYQPWLLKSLQGLSRNPHWLPHRIVQPSAAPSVELSHLFMPTVADDQVGIKILTGGPSNLKSQKGFVGSVAVLDETDGSLQGIVNARTLTAFRTALASTIPMVKVVNPQEMLTEVTVLGSGLQAYWHARLVLILYDNITTVHLVNRSVDNAETLAGDLQPLFPKVKFHVHLYTSADDQEKGLWFANSSIILGCLPSTEPVIKQQYINSDPKYIKYINLIGSYKPHMIELDLALLEGEQKIIVDSKEHCLHESGELIMSHKTEEDLVEIAEFAANDFSSVKSDNNVIILKLVGLAVMDISMAQFLLNRSTNVVDVEF